TMAVQSARIAAERNKAVQEKAKADAINEFLVETLGSANPIEGTGRDVTVLEALKSAAEKIDTSFAEQPEIAADLKQTIGVTYLRLGYYDQAEPLLRSSLKMCETLFGPDSPKVSAPLSALAILRQERGDLAEAETLIRRGLEIKVKQEGEESANAANLMNNLALLLEEKGDLAEAERLYRRVLEIDRKVHGERDLNVGIDLNNLGVALGKRGDFTAGEAALREAVAIFRENNHPWLGVLLGNLGDLLTHKGDPSAALPFFEEGLPLGLKSLGEKNQDLAKLRYKYGLCLTRLGRYAEAESELRAGYDVLRATMPLESYWVQRAVAAFVELYAAWGKAGRADEFRVLVRTKS
ncbi:MAG: tetratricopeptide repeat protein, partial [Candidatus Aminicenantes bacterium]|nr:tetratricopeptide repeat protein [Candidatus Aminicenantes bacterium]